jgi:hypothetical protein
MVLSENQKIGVGLISLGAFFVFLGIVLFLDAGLIAIGTWMGGQLLQQAILLNYSPYMYMNANMLLAVNSSLRYSSLHRLLRLRLLTPLFCYCRPPPPPPGNVLFLTGIVFSIGIKRTVALFSR